MVDGSHQQIRIEPNSKSIADKKLLEYIAEWDIGVITVKRDTYARDIEKIDLVLEVKEGKLDTDGNVSCKVPTYPESN